MGWLLHARPTTTRAWWTLPGSLAVLLVATANLPATAQQRPAASAAVEERVAQARERGYWVIRPGEHLYAISRHFVTGETEARQLAKDIESLNPNAFILGDPARLIVGARLRLPERLIASGASAPPSKTTPSPSATAASSPAPPPAPAAASPRTPVAPTASEAPAPTATGAAVPAPGSPASAPSDRVMPLEVTVNGAKSGTWLLVERAGVLYAPREAFDEWRIEWNPGSPAIDFKGQVYGSLSAVPGFKAKLNVATQSLELLFAPEVFTAMKLTKELSKRPVVTPVLPSAFLNYDMNFAATEPRDARSIRDLGVLTEVGVSNSWGVLTSSQLGRNLTGDTALGNSRRFLRLETTFTRDFPDENRTLRLGDTSTLPGLWGRSVYFGGIQYGTNFALTPGFVSQPLPTLRGLSVAPSTVELYVNDVLRQVSTVPTGPFSIDNAPLMTGNGDARLVVRDLLGRETVIVQSFFTSGRLLARGLDDWSIEAGSLRRDLGVENSNYGPGFASARWRRGVTDSLTLEGRVEATSRLQALGLGASTVLPGRFLGTAAFAASEHRERGSGGLWLLALEREGLRSSFSFQAQGTSRNFRPLGQDQDLPLYRTQVAGNWTYYTDKVGSFGVGFANIYGFDEPRVSTVSGNYSVGIGERSNLSLTVSHAVAGATGTSVGMSFIMPLDNTRTLSASSNSRGGMTDFYAAASKNPAQDDNLGWRTLVGRQQEQARVEGGLYYLGQRGSLSGELSLSRDLSALRLGTTGGLVLADGSLFSTRRVNESFAVARVAGYGDVGIGIGSNVLTRTDASGTALIPQLWPYTNNSIRIDPRELPLSAEIDSIEQVVVPAWRSAVKVDFPVRSGRGALLRIVMENGEVAPAGAIVRIDGDKQEFYVARRGEAFVTGLQPTNRLVLKATDRQCSFEVTLPPGTPEEITRLGPLTCKAVPR